MIDKDYLSYKAINVFIERDYLEKILESILTGKDKLSKEEQIAFNNQFRKYVNILGFRNPSRAPLSLQVNAYASAFEEKEEIIPFTLSIWTKLNKNIAEVVYQWLEDEGWENLSLERTYQEDGGFIDDWPEKCTFDDVVEKFSDAKPDLSISRDDLILLVLWISGRLPKE